MSFCGGFQSSTTSTSLTPKEQELVLKLAAVLQRCGTKILSNHTVLCLTTQALSTLNRSFLHIPDDYLVPTDLTSDGAIVLSGGDFSDVAASLRVFFRKTPALKIMHDSVTIVGLLKLHQFTSLTTLELKKVPIHLLSGLALLRSRLVTVICSRCLHNIQDLFETCGADMSTPMSWPRLKEAQLSYNNITRLDASLRLVPMLESIDLSHNSIPTTQKYLEYLTEIDRVNLGFNQLSHVPSFSITARSRLKHLVLRNNLLDKIDGVELLLNLRLLDVSSNCLVEHKCLHVLNHLDKLHTLWTSDNPLAYHKHHRGLTIHHLTPTCRYKTFILDGKAITSLEHQHVVSSRIAIPTRTNILKVDSMTSSVTTGPTAKVVDPDESLSKSLPTTRTQRSKRRRSKGKVKSRHAVIAELDSSDWGGTSSHDSSPAPSPTTSTLKDNYERLRAHHGPNWLAMFNQSTKQTQVANVSATADDLYMNDSTEVIQSGPTDTTDGNTTKPVNGVDALNKPETKTGAIEDVRAIKSQESVHGLEWSVEDTERTELYGEESDPFLVQIPTLTPEDNHLFITINNRYLTEKDVYGNVIEMLDLRLLTTIVFLSSNSDVNRSKDSSMDSVGSKSLDGVTGQGGTREGGQFRKSWDGLGKGLGKDGGADKSAAEVTKSTEGVGNLKGVSNHMNGVNEENGMSKTSLDSTNKSGSVRGISVESGKRTENVNTMNIKGGTNVKGGIEVKQNGKVNVGYRLTKSGRKIPIKSSLDAKQTVDTAKNKYDTQINLDNSGRYPDNIIDHTTREITEKDDAYRGEFAVKLLFDYRRKDRREREYIMEDRLAVEHLHDLVRPYIDAHKEKIRSETEKMYECLKCSKTFTFHVPHHDTDPESTCPKCGSELIVELSTPDAPDTPIGSYTSASEVKLRSSTPKSAEKHARRGSTPEIELRKAEKQTTSKPPKRSLFSSLKADNTIPKVKSSPNMENIAEIVQHQKISFGQSFDRILDNNKVDMDTVNWGNLENCEEVTENMKITNSLLIGELRNGNLKSQINSDKYRTETTTIKTVTSGSDTTVLSNPSKSSIAVISDPNVAKTDKVTSGSDITVLSNPSKSSIAVISDPNVAKTDKVKFTLGLNLTRTEEKVVDVGSHVDKTQIDVKHKVERETVKSLNPFDEDDEDLTDLPRKTSVAGDSIDAINIADDSYCNHSDEELNQSHSPLSSSICTSMVTSMYVNSMKSDADDNTGESGQKERLESGDSVVTLDASATSIYDSCDSGAFVSESSIQQGHNSNPFLENSTQNEQCTDADNSNPFLENTNPFEENTNLFKENTNPFEENTNPFETNTNLFENDDAQNTPMNNSKTNNQTSKNVSSTKTKQTNSSNIKSKTRISQSDRDQPVPNSNVDDIETTTPLINSSIDSYFSSKSEAKTKTIHAQSKTKNRQKKSKNSSTKTVHAQSKVIDNEQVTDETQSTNVHDQAKNKDVQSTNVNHQAKSKDVQSTNVNHQAKSKDVQSTNVNHQAKSKDIQSTDVNLQAKSKDVQSTNVNHQAKSKDVQSTDVNHQAKNKDIQSTDVNHQAKSKDVHSISQNSGRSKQDSFSNSLELLANSKYSGMLSSYTPGNTETKTLSQSKVNGNLSKSTAKLTDSFTNSGSENPNSRLTNCLHDQITSAKSLKNVKSRDKNIKAKSDEKTATVIKDPPSLNTRLKRYLSDIPSPATLMLNDGERFYGSSNNFADIDHRLKLYFEMSLFKEVNEECRCFLQCGCVKYNVAAEFTAMLLVSSHNVYILRVLDNTHDLPEKYIQTVDKQPMTEIRYVDIGLGGQSFRLEFGHVTGSYSFVVCDEARCRHFVGVLTGILQSTTLSDHSKLEGITKYCQATLDNLDAQVFCYCSPEELSDRETPSHLVKYIKVFITTDCPVLSTEPNTAVSLAITKHDLLMVTENHQWPLPRLQAPPCDTIKGQQFTVHEHRGINQILHVAISRDKLTTEIVFLNDENIEQTWLVSVMSPRVMDVLLDAIRGPWESQFGISLDVGELKEQCVK